MELLPRELTQCNFQKARREKERERKRYLEQNMEANLVDIPAHSRTEKYRIVYRFHFKYLPSISYCASSIFPQKNSPDIVPEIEGFLFVNQHAVIRGNSNPWTASHLYVHVRAVRFLLLLQMASNPIGGSNSLTFSECREIFQ